jgi:hypothetical protein
MKRKSAGYSKGFLADSYLIVWEMPDGTREWKRTRVDETVEVTIERLSDKGATVIYVFNERDAINLDT